MEKAYEIFDRIQNDFLELKDSGRGNLYIHLDCDMNNAEEKYKYKVAVSVIRKLNSINKMLTWVNTPTCVEGRLRKNNRGHYEVQNVELPAGFLLDYWDEYLQEWVNSVLGHNGEDYCIAKMGSKKNIEGVWVRLKYIP